MELEPAEAIEYYIGDRTDVTESTIDNIRYRLGKFTDWGNGQGIAVMNDVRPKHIHEYKVSLAESGLANITLKNHLTTVRQLVVFCQDMNMSEEPASGRPAPEA